MTDPQPAPRRFRFTWLTLGELVGVVALVIAGLNFWESHREHVREDRLQAASDRRAVVAQALLLTGAADGSGDRLRLQPARAGQVIQSQIVVLPTEVRTDAVSTTGDSRIERGWLEAGVRAARERIGDASAPGDRRLPVGLETVYLADGEAHTDRAIYDVGYLLQPRLIGGAKVQLEGLSLVRRGVNGDLRARVDAVWAARTAAETAAALAGRR